MTDYPFTEGDITVLGPQVFVARDGSVLNWRGVNYVPQGDEHHTMEELYLYRMLYNAHAVNAWAKAGTYPVVKSWRHSDGELAFGGGWFIVVAALPTGQVSNHYKAESWGLFDVPEVELPPPYDGHTSRDAAQRLFEAL